MRKGDWIQTFTGVAFYPLDPRPEEIRIEDIAHALAHQCRFSGHCREFYSVAEHSVRVARELPADIAMWGLLHDASEAYLVDLPRPIKRYSEMGRLYREHEAALMSVMCDRFGLPQEEPLAVKRMDTILLMTEKRDIMGGCNKAWEDIELPLPSTIRPWGAKTAERRFLLAYERLGRTPATVNIVAESVNSAGFENERKHQGECGK